MLPDTDRAEQRELAFHYLCTLLPEVDPGEISVALKETDKPGLLATIVESGQKLGAQFYRVTADLKELAANSSTLPALETGDTPRIIVAHSKGRVRVQEGTTQETLLASEWSEKKSSYLVPSPRMTLSALRGRKGLSRVLSYLATERPLLKAILVYAVFVEALSLAAPLAVQVLINTIGFGMMTQQLIVISALLLVALAGAAVLSVLQVFMVEHLSRRFFARALMDFSERLPITNNAGMKHRVHRFFEVASVDKTFFVLGLDLIALFLQLLAATVLLALYHPILLGFTGVMMLSAWLVVSLPFRRGLKRSIEESYAKYELAQFLEEGKGDELERVGLWSRWRVAREAGFRIAMGQQAGLYGIQVILAVALLFVGGGLVIEGQLTLGQLVAAELVAGTALLSLSKLGKQLPKVYDLITSFDKLGAVVDLPFDEQPTGFSTPPSRSLVEAPRPHGEAS